MVRNIDAILAQHRQHSPTSIRSSLVELLLKLSGAAPPDLQAAEIIQELPWEHWIDQVYDGLAVRRHAWADCPPLDLLRAELAAGRPVALMLERAFTDSGRRGERGWIAVACNTVGDQTFLDLVGKIPDPVNGDAQFSEKKAVRTHGLGRADVSIVLYCERLFGTSRPTGGRAAAPQAVPRYDGPSIT